MEDTKPIRIETQGIEITEDKKTILTANILHLNTDKVIEHGFEFLYISYIDNQSIEKTKTYPITEKAVPGRVSLALEDNILNELTNLSRYRYYIKTDKDEIKGNYVPLYITTTQDFSIHPNQAITGYSGETVKLKGNFKDVSIKYDLYIGDHPTPIPYNISNNSIDLSFTLPVNGFKEEASVYLIKKEDTSNYPSQFYIASVKYLTRINPPDDYNISPYSYLHLTVKEGPAYNSSIIIGNKLVPYRDYIMLSDYISPDDGDVFRLGYYDGRDTVIFPKKLQIFRPDINKIYFPSLRAHPSGNALVLGLSHDQLFGDVAFSLGSHPVHMGYDNQGIYSIYPGSLPDGEYPLEIKSKNYHLISQKKLKIETLKATHLTQNGQDMGSTVTVFGNFIKGHHYNIMLDNNGHYGIPAEEGKLNFTIPMLKGGKHNLTIGYTDAHENSSTAIQTNLTIEVNQFTFTSFSPLKGNTSTNIRLKGKSIAFAMIYFGDNWVHASQVGNSHDEVIISLPFMTQPGKYKISARIGERWLQLSDAFEVTNP
ncbi:MULTISPECIES: hypothetical protein [Sphingobacterium]|nr:MULTISPECIES: hypothetical protein [Sphingobacterium]